MDDASPNDGETFPGAARQLHVSNIPFELGAEALANIFAGVPGVVQTQMPVERDTGKPKGFGFVRFDNEQDAAAAREKFDNFQVAGRALRVKPAYREWRDKSNTRTFDNDPPAGGRVHETIFRSDREEYPPRGRERERSPFADAGADRFRPSGGAAHHRSRSRSRSRDRDRYGGAPQPRDERMYGREGGDYRGNARMPVASRWEERGASPPPRIMNEPQFGMRAPPMGGGARETTPPYRGPPASLSPPRGSGLPSFPRPSGHGPPPPSQRVDPYQHARKFASPQAQPPVRHSHGPEPVVGGRYAGEGDYHSGGRGGGYDRGGEPYGSTHRSDGVPRYADDHGAHHAPRGGYASTRGPPQEAAYYDDAPPLRSRGGYGTDAGAYYSGSGGAKPAPAYGGGGYADDGIMDAHPRGSAGGYYNDAPGHSRGGYAPREGGASYYNER